MDNIESKYKEVMGGYNSILTGESTSYALFNDRELLLISDLIGRSLAPTLEAYKQPNIQANAEVKKLYEQRLDELTALNVELQNQMLQNLKPKKKLAQA